MTEQIVDMVTVNCAYCGKAFERKAKSEARYCSKECRSGARLNWILITPDTKQYIILACPSEGWRYDMSYNYHLYGYDIYLSSGHRLPLTPEWEDPQTEKGPTVIIKRAEPVRLTRRPKYKGVRS